MARSRTLVGSLRRRLTTRLRRKPDHFTRLPVEILLEIGQYCRLGEISRLVCVSSHFKDTFEGLLFRTDARRSRPLALLWAARNGNANVARKAIAAGNVTVGSTNDDLKDERMMTPLHHAVLRGYEDIVEMLLAPRAANSEGSMPRVPKTWININSRDCDRNSALHMAADGGHVRIFERLMRVENVNLNILSQDYLSPLVTAITRKCRPIVDLLLDSDEVSLIAATLRDETLLNRIDWSGDAEVLRRVLERGILDVNRKTGKRSDYRMAPLLLAALCGHEDMTAALLEVEGIDIETTETISFDGVMTPLRAAEEGKHWGVAAQLKAALEKKKKATRTAQRELKTGQSNASDTM